MKQYRIMYTTKLGNTTQLITANNEAEAKHRINKSHGVIDSQIIKIAELKTINK